MIRFNSFHESLTLGGCLCVMFLCEKRKRIWEIVVFVFIYWSMTLKVTWILVFLLGVCYT
jgi:hypothetical protein